MNDIQKNTGTNKTCPTTHQFARSMLQRVKGSALQSERFFFLCMFTVNSKYSL